MKNKCFKIDFYDPLADSNEVKSYYGKNQITKFSKNNYDGVIIAVGHKQFKSMGINYIKSMCKKNHVIFDLKGYFKKVILTFSFNIYKLH